MCMCVCVCVHARSTEGPPGSHRHSFLDEPAPCAQLRRTGAQMGGADLASSPRKQRARGGQRALAVSGASPAAGCVVQFSLPPASPRIGTTPGELPNPLLNSSACHRDQKRHQNTFLEVTGGYRMHRKARGPTSAVASTCTFGTGAWNPGAPEGHSLQTSHCEGPATSP